jgi:WD40 repeat protein/DNA-binding SARP family transcriptional activator
MGRSVTRATDDPTGSALDALGAPLCANSATVLTGATNATGAMAAGFGRVFFMAPQSFAPLPVLSRLAPEALPSISMGLEFRILGSLDVLVDGESLRLGGPKQRGVLAVLLLRANTVVPVEQLASDLYGEEIPPTAVAQVRDHVSQLRKLLDPGHRPASEGGLLETRAPGYVLHLDLEQLDASRFEARLEEATRAIGRGDFEFASAELRNALALWRGPPLADFSYESFAQAAIGRLEELRLTARERRIEADLRLGSDGSLVGELEELLAEHPLREQLRAQLMLALYRSGRQAEALEVYQVARRQLVEELGLEPSPALRELESKMLRHDPSLERPPHQARQTADEPEPLDSELRNPYKGLRAFGEADAPDFFGREGLTSLLLDRLAASRFLAVVGPSGSGKSSVVRAGLIPGLLSGSLPGSEAWRVAVLTPGAYPLEELEACLLRIAINPPASLIEQLEGDDRGLLRAVKRVLPGDDSELVLVVDQLEELFTLVTDENLRAHVLSILERAVSDPHSRVRVVVTLRADFYDRPLLYRDFAELLRDRVVTVSPLSPDAIERAISEPARRSGITFEQGLLAEIVADVLDEPGALPLLQYALTELFEHRDGRTLTRSAYESIGGVSGALTGRAEEAYLRLDADGQAAARQLFLRLVTLGDGADTRRRVARAELASLEVDQEALARCIDAFGGGSRLLFFDRDPRTQASTLEIAHEALLGEWERLRGWIEAAREDVRVHRRLATATAEWEESGGDPSFLLRGSQLVRFETWAADSGLAQTQRDRAYLRASLERREVEQTAEESRRAREAALEQRSLNRLRALAGVLAVASLVAAGLTVFAFDQSNRSKREARIATARQLAAASVANLDVDPELSILLALQAFETTRRGRTALPEAVEALHRAIAASRVLVTIPNAAPAAVAFSPDGSRLATGGPSKASPGAAAQAFVWNARTGRRLLSLRGAPSRIDDIAYSPDGARLVTGSDNGTATIWDAHDGRRLFAMPDLDAGGSLGVAFSPGGTRLATDDESGRLRIWDLRSRHVVRTLRSAHPLCGVSWSSDGTRVGTGDCASIYAGATGRVWDVRTGKQAVATKQETGAILTVRFSPDGRHFATPSLNGTAEIWNARTGRLEVTFRGHTGQVAALAYSPDGTRIATSGTDGTARVWDALNGKPRLVLRGHNGAVDDVAFSPDGRRLATASEDGSARIWDVTPEGGRDWLTLAAHKGAVESVYYSPDGSRLLTSGLVDGTAKIWNARTGTLIHTYHHPVNPGEAYTPASLRNNIFGGAASADGKLVASVDSDGTVEVKDASTGDVRARLASRHQGVQSVAFDLSGRRVATGNFDGTAVVWDAASGRPLLTLAAHTGTVEGLAFSPDGTLLATAGEDTTAKLWDLRTGNEVLTLTGHSFALTDVAFSPDGTRLATSSGDGTVRVYVLPLDQLMTVARSRLTRGWTPDECKRYLPGRSCPRNP